MFTRIFTATMLGSALLVAGATTAHAGKPDHVDRYHVQDAGEHELTELCDFKIDFTVDARGTARFWDDGRIHANDHGTMTLSNPSNGRSLTRSWAGSFKGQSTETFNDDGTITFSWNDTNHGLHEKWKSSDGGVLIADRGTAHFVGSETFDPMTGQWSDFDEKVTTHGPHPILDGGGLNPALACDYLA